MALYLTASRIMEVSGPNSPNQYRLRAKFLLSKVLRKLLCRYMFNQALKDFSWLFSSIVFFGGDIQICDVWSIRAQLVFGNETRSLYTMRTNATANCLSAFACGKSRELTMWARLHKLPSSVALRRQLRAKIWLTISRKRWRVSRKNPVFLNEMILEVWLLTRLIYEYIISYVLYHIISNYIVYYRGSMLVSWHFLDRGVPTDSSLSLVHRPKNWGALGWGKFLKNPRQQKPRKWKWNEAATLSAFPSCLVSYLDNLIYTYAYTYIYICIHTSLVKVTKCHLQWWWNHRSIVDFIFFFQDIVTSPKVSMAVSGTVTSYNPHKAPWVSRLCPIAGVHPGNWGENGDILGSTLMKYVRKNCGKT